MSSEETASEYVGLIVRSTTIQEIVRHIFLSTFSLLSFNKHLHDTLGLHLACHCACYCAKHTTRCNNTHLQYILPE